MSYGCECNGEVSVGREEPQKTDGIIKVVRAWTGDEPVGCPWFAFRDPFVARVLRVYQDYEGGQLLAVEPEPSRRLIEGLQHYRYVSNRYTAMRFEADKNERERQRSARGQA